MRKKMVLVLDVDVNDKLDLQELTDKMSVAIQTVDGIVVHDFVMFDNDENSSDRISANLK